jgi:hypothetical protein
MRPDNHKKEEFATKVSLIGIFLSLFIGFASRFNSKKAERRLEKMSSFDLALLGLSTFRLGRLVSYERVFEPIRSLFTETVQDEFGAGETVEPKGKGIQKSLGELISCPICSGTWIAAGLVYGMQLLPRPTRLFLWINSTIGLAEIFNAVTEAFSWWGQEARKKSGNGS